MKKLQNFAHLSGQTVPGRVPVETASFRNRKNSSLPILGSKKVLLLLLPFHSTFSSLRYPFCSTCQVGQGAGGTQEYALHCCCCCCWGESWGGLMMPSLLLLLLPLGSSPTYFIADQTTTASYDSTRTWWRKTQRDLSFRLPVTLFTKITLCKAESFCPGVS